MTLRRQVSELIVRKIAFTSEVTSLAETVFVSSVASELLNGKLLDRLWATILCSGGSWGGWFVSCQLCQSLWCSMEKHPVLKLSHYDSSFPLDQKGANTDKYVTLIKGQVSPISPQIISSLPYSKSQRFILRPQMLTLRCHCSQGASNADSPNRNVHISCLGLQATPSEVCLLCKGWVCKQELEIETRRLQVWT